MSDLAEFLKARLDEDEAAAKARSPARVLREVEAKRAIVTRCECVLIAFTDPASGLWPDVNRRERSHADATLCNLAFVYSDHPDWDREWVPAP